MVLLVSNRGAREHKSEEWESAFILTFRGNDAELQLPLRLGVTSLLMRKRNLVTIFSALCACTWALAADCSNAVPAKTATGASPAPVQSAAAQARQARSLLSAEIGRINFASMRLAIEDMAETFKSAYPKKAEYLATVGRLESDRPTLVAALSGTSPGVEARAAEFLRQAREPLLANPLLDSDRILLLRRTFPGPEQAIHAMGVQAGLISLNAHTSDTIPRQNAFKDELTVLSGLRGKPSFAPVYAPSNGDTIIDPVLHFDGAKLLFARNGDREKNWR